jgi:N-acetyl-beta-hexosaminidase
MVALLFSGSRSYGFAMIYLERMIDAARHFQPVDVIKNLNAMASMKMNVFHWHLADDQGWRIEIKKAS